MTPVRFLVALLLLAPAAATAEDAPLYASFQKFCVATGGTPVAVEDAMEAAGGKMRSAPDDSEPGSAVSIAAWDYRAGGEDMTIVAGTERIPAQGGVLRDATACVIEAQARDDAGAFAIRQWVGVPPSHVQSGDTLVTRFDFRVAGGVRTAAPVDRAAYGDAAAAGQIWSLILRQSQTLTSVHLIHIVPEQP